MSVSIALLKILSSYPNGQASLASLKADFAMLSTSEWLARMRVLRARAGSTNIFSDKFVTRDAYGWTITDAGREFLDKLESREEFQLTDAARPGLRVVSSKGKAPSKPFEKPLLKLVRSA
jgi:hypothetical protein